MPHDSIAWVANVSTHSRPKAAALGRKTRCRSFSGFNTQPPEGGCAARFTFAARRRGFNTQPPEGGCRYI